MLRRGARALLLWVLLGLTTGGAWAQPQPQLRRQPEIAGRRVALVVGNGAYRSVDRLPNTANDARLIASTLRAQGFELVGGGPQLDLDRATLSQAIQAFGKALAGADVGLFYYSGHGLQVSGVNWLVPVDANPGRPQDLDFQMVDADLVLRQMDGAGTKLNLVLLDACRNNPFATRGFRSLQAGLAEMRAPEGTLISYATQPGNVAADGVGPNSPYTTALARSMTQPGLDIFRLFNQVGLEVKRGTGGGQQPWVSTSPIDGDFYFAGVGTGAGVGLEAGAGAGAGAAAAVVHEAGLVRGPDPVVGRSGELGVVRAMARAARCSILDARTIQGRVALIGLALPGPDWDALLQATGGQQMGGQQMGGQQTGGQQMGATRGVRVVPEGLTFLPPFACALVDRLGEPIRRTREHGGLLVLLRPAPGRGKQATFRVRGAAGRVLTLDLFQAGDVVQHLASPAPITDDPATVGLPEGRIAGAGIVLAVSSALPLELGARPQAEPAGPYLAALAEALGRQAGARVDLGVIDVRAAPVRATPVTIAAVPAGRAAATSARAQARSPQCAAILERAQLGEAPSERDRDVLRSSCR